MDEIERALRIAKWGTASTLGKLKNFAEDPLFRAFSRDLPKVDHEDSVLATRLLFVQNDRDPDEIVLHAAHAELEWLRAVETHTSLSRSEVLEKLVSDRGLAQVLRSPSALGAWEEIERSDPRALVRVIEAARLRLPRINRATAGQISRAWHLVRVFRARRKSVSSLRRFERSVLKGLKLRRPEARERAREKFWSEWAENDSVRQDIARRMLSVGKAGPQDPQTPDEVAASWACEDALHEFLQPAAAVKRVEAARSLVVKRMKDPPLPGTSLNWVQFLKLIEKSV